MTLIHIIYTETTNRKHCIDYFDISFQRGAALNFWTETQLPPLCQAVFENQYNITKMLIDEGVLLDVLWKSSNGKCKYTMAII